MKKQVLTQTRSTTNSFVLKIIGNKIEDTEATLLGAALKLNTTLTTLNLSCNHYMTKNGVHQQIYFASFTSKQQITILEIQEQQHWVKHWWRTQHLQNFIWMVNTKEYSQNHTPNRSPLKTGNCIDDQGKQSFNEALKTNTTITDLILGGKDKTIIYVFHDFIFLILQNRYSYTWSSNDGKVSNERINDLS